MANAVTLLRKFLHASVPAGAAARHVRLPPERELALRLAVPRAAVRDALVILENEGFVERRRGSGTYLSVDGVRSARTGPGDSDVSPAQLMEARLAIEPQFAELVVTNATAVDFENIERCNEETRLAKSAEEFSEKNAKLHAAIASATRNEFLTQVFGLVLNAQRHPAWGELARRPTTASQRREYQREHDSIVAALRARNVEAARTAMAGHLRHARRALLRGK